MRRIVVSGFVRLDGNRAKHGLKLNGTRAFESGVVALCYRNA
jgi:hypothetical protein